MERNYMKPDVLVELDFITEQHMGIHYHENFEMLYVVSGKLEISVEEDTYQLTSGDVLVVNANRKHSYDSSRDFVAGRFLISYRKMQELLGQNYVLFWCNSTIDNNAAYENLRRIVVQLFNQSLRKNKNSTLYVNSLHYQILHILAENFLLTEKDVMDKETQMRTRNDDRMQEIFSYICSNYHQNIILDDLSKHLYLSPTYVSRYIKQKCGFTFGELLNTVRLERAMEDLLYTNDSIMKIALGNGFANLAAYNKAFKKAYQMTPSEFRKSRKSKTKEISNQEKNQKELIYRKVDEYLERDLNEQEPERELLELEAPVDLALDEVMTDWDGYSCKMINAGTAMDLLNSTFQEQIMSSQARLGFEYVRFWDISAPELLIDIHAPAGHLNFSRLNNATDFLVRNQLKPYIELGFKPLRILKTTKSALKEVERDDAFVSEKEMRTFYRELIHNFLKRYGYEEVESWYFEYWEPTNMRYRDLNAFHFTEMEEAGHQDYFRCFTIVAEELRKCVPHVRIGGGGFPVRMYGEKGFTQMLTNWKGESQRPDFISLSCYPYIQERENGVYCEKRNTDLQFVLHDIDMAEKAMKQSEFPETEIHVSEYSLSLSNRNIINDSCVKGAFLVYNGILCLGRVKLMGHWLFTDAYAEWKDTPAPLFGGCGMLTKDGIKKPAYFAMEFFNRLYRNVLAVHSNYIITGNKRGSIRLLCHNMKRLNYNYYILDEDAIQPRDLLVILENREYLTIHLRVDYAKDGTFYVKRNRVSQNHGSVQDKWCGLNSESNLTEREMEYLKSSSTSTISIEEVEVENGVLKVDISLEPNEIQYIHILTK
ncbi:MAG: helix-turn-helix domain-containing protein [Clostridiales bacterium]|nr:helix-turn-helix domain-containing protein [Clostridiales bacterium]